MIIINLILITNIDRININLYLFYEHFLSKLVSIFSLTLIGFFMFNVMLRNDFIKFIYF